VRLASGKWKIRSALLSLENIRTTANDLPSDLLEWSEEYPKHLAHVFPHGLGLYETQRRIIPRTREMVAILAPTAATIPGLVLPTNRNGKHTTLKSIPLEISVPSPKSLKDIQSSSVSSPKSPKRVAAILISSPKSPKRLKAIATRTLSPRSPKRLKSIVALSAQSKMETTIKDISMPDANNVGGNGNKLLVVVGSNSAPTTTENKDDDHDSGISLDDLKCCVCFAGDATDDNDVLLCDGQGCCRAFHMNCVFPQVHAKDIEDENEDWFCPLCNAISHLTAEVQLACMEEDWEHRRETEDYQLLESSSLHSWGNAVEAFPEAEWEYETSMKYKAGKQNEDTARLLGVYLGEEFFQGTAGGAVPMPVGSDSEDENDYSLFDEESFDERRRLERERVGDKDDDDDDDKDDGGSHDDDKEDSDDDSDESTRSSQASLVDMSSVELNIGKSELAALSDGGGGSSSKDDSSLSGAPSISSAKQRRSRRLRTKNCNISGHSSLADPGADFDENNIIEGKRRRNFVDYRKLNDALFGDLSAKERAKIDDKDDFQVRKKKKKTPKKNPNGGHNRRKKAKTVDEEINQEDGSDSEDSNSSGNSEEGQSDENEDSS
jgi:hypothetical protein